MGCNNLIYDGLNPLAMESTLPRCFLKKNSYTIAVYALSPQFSGWEILYTVIDEVFAHHWHRAEHSWYPVLIDCHAPQSTMRSEDSPVNGSFSGLGVSISLIQRVGSGSNSQLKNFPFVFIHEHVNDFPGITGVFQGIFYNLEFCGVIGKMKTQFIRRG